MSEPRAMWWTWLMVAVTGCGLSEASAVEVGAERDEAAQALKLSLPLRPADFGAPVSKADIRALQAWVDDATFEEKWVAMQASPLAFFGGADSFYHADLRPLAARLPGDQTLCHGDPKLDNFGWVSVKGQSVFSSNDFDDAGYCPVAADALRYLVATDLWFSDATLTSAALEAYVATVLKASSAVSITSAAPNWDEVRAKGLEKDTRGDALVLRGEVQAASASEVAAVRALFASDDRFPRTLLDVARDVRVDGGSAGLRRFWLFTEDKHGVRTVLELKELTTPGTEFGWHSATLDGADRLDVLKDYWWGVNSSKDHFLVDLLGARFVARDRLGRANLKVAALSAAEVKNAVQAEASLLALRHAQAWGKVKPSSLRSWLRESAGTLAARWREAQASGR